MVAGISSAVIRGSSVKASAAGARTGKSGGGVLSQSRRKTGDGAGCRSVALREATSSSQYQQCKQYAVPVW
ncbi:hypothetical protein GCM10010272_47900 [Streptomyces lateritius]|nr:hypothetical protein GCM10010272_47900 [Streptomyces lateritius]